MAPMTTMAFPDYGLRSDDIKYFKMDTIIKGRGPDRLKYLDLEGRWVLSGKSIPFINSAFNHLQTLNSARVPFREIIDQPLNAIGMVGWTPSSEPVKVEKKTAPPKFVAPPPVIIDEEVPQSPREIMPHRSAGYGPAHQKRKLSIPDRSRSVSPVSPARGGESPIPVFDKYAKFERNRKESITRYGTRWGTAADYGYSSASPSPTPGDRPPHRTQPLSPRSVSQNGYDTLYEPPFDLGDRSYKDELSIRTKTENKLDMPYRTHGYGDYHSRRKYDISPRSTGSTGDYSGSEQSSPVPAERSADEIMLLAYHSRGNLPRMNNSRAY
ncbi:unnamed protein product [Auanema sp. JU1783]|nr:unnamed protein product [Auanema sp. JU1783]